MTHNLGGKIFETHIKGTEKLMIKIDPLTMDSSFYKMEKYIDGDWRKGHDIHKVVITKRFYQISPHSKQA